MLNLKNNLAPQTILRNNIDFFIKAHKQSFNTLQTIQKMGFKGFKQFSGQAQNSLSAIPASFPTAQKVASQSLSLMETSVTNAFDFSAQVLQSTEQLTKEWLDNQVKSTEKAVEAVSGSQNQKQPEAMQASAD